MVRLKSRYLLINILYPASSSVQKSDTATPAHIEFHQPTSDALTPQILIRAIKAEISVLFGDYGVGVISGSLAVKYLSPATSTAIIRVSRAHYRIVWAALSFIAALPPDKKPCVIQVVRVSGTIKKAEQEAIKRARASIMSARRAAGDAGENDLGRFLTKVGEGDVGEGEAMEGIEDDEDDDVDDVDDDEEEDEGEGEENQDADGDGVG
ncbi:MAG: hypothetical protein M1812_000759 [Candelaria pacifica]|nr:MAG: hypothetical protein M1812_000759 [Candelaria pacifica]